jgi:hypothetical protein
MAWLLSRIERNAAEIARNLASLQDLLQSENASRYPAFTPEQIAFANEESQKLRQQCAERLALASNRQTDVQTIETEGAEDIWLHAQSGRADKLHDFMIESNIAVVSGQKTLKQVRAEWSELYFGVEWMTAAFKQRDEWCEKVKGFTQKST